MSIHVLVPEQSRELLKVHAQIAATTPSVDTPRNVIRMIADIVATRVALVAKEEGSWTVLAEGGQGPALPALEGELAVLLDRVGGGETVVLERWRYQGEAWTLVGLTRRIGAAVVLMLHGDWTLSESALLQLGNTLLLAECAYTLASSAHVRRATHRLSRALARTTGLRQVSDVAVRHAARAVQAQMAALAVASPDGQTLSLMATHGYPLTLVEHLRIPRGVGILGSVLESGLPLRVNDITTFKPGLRRRMRYRTNSFVVVPITTGDREVLGAICVTDRADGRAFTHDDVSTLRTLAATVALALARERAHAQAHSYAQAAAIDPVSGLYNRRYFEARLEEEVQRAHRHGLSVGLLMIDLDDFKSINDQFGHLAGDMVIRDIGEILRRSVRVFDVCTRYGGEEFAVVMPGSGPEEAARIAERIRELVEAYRPADPDMGGLRVTASIGSSVLATEATARDLISVADQALYLAKRGGKNQVRAGEV